MSAEAGEEREFSGSWPWDLFGDAPPWAGPQSRAEHTGALAPGSSLQPMREDLLARVRTFQVA